MYWHTNKYWPKSAVHRIKVVPRLKDRRQAFFYRFIYFFIPLLLLTTVISCGPQENAASDEAVAFDHKIINTQALSDSVKCLAPSPKWYKNLWLDINAEENQLGQRFMSHYMSCSGSAYHLSEEEFKSLPVFIVPNQSNHVNLSREYIAELTHHQAGNLGQKIMDIDGSILAASHFGNTLGNFQLKLKGVVIWKQNAMGEIVPGFEGKAKIFDRYDFNPSVTTAADSWRGRDTELRVRIAHMALPGKAFDVSSDWMDFRFDLPKYDYDFINEGQNSERSGYSEYGERLQSILAVELRSSAWDNASSFEKFKIIVTTLKKIHETIYRDQDK